jgi:hypothetical protein
MANKNLSLNNPNQIIDGFGIKSKYYSQALKSSATFSKSKKKAYFKEYIKYIIENGLIWDGCLSPILNKLISYKCLPDNLQMEISKTQFVLSIKKVKESSSPRLTSYYCNKQLHQLPVKVFYHYIKNVNNKLSYRNTATKQMYEITFISI